MLSQIALKVVSAGWLIAKIISYRLWLSDRAFPLVAPFKFLIFPGWLHIFLFIGSIFLLLFVLFQPGNSIAILALVAVEFVSCLADMTRWQPWQYLYLTLLVVHLVYKNNSKNLFKAYGIVMFSTYFFSGLSKLNGGFILLIWKRMILLRFMKLPASMVDMSVVNYLGYAIPGIEVLCSLLLFSKKYRSFAAVVLIVTHLFIMVMLGPVGLNFNPVVWPWNGVMIVLLYLLFFNSTCQLSLGACFNKNMLWLSILWIILPVTNFFGFWDDYLSSNLYSGKTKHLYVCMDTTQYVLPKILKVNMSDKKNALCENAATLSVSNWSLMELNVPAYPEKRYYIRLATMLSEKYPQNNSQFYLYDIKRGYQTLPFRHTH